MPAVAGSTQRPGWPIMTGMDKPTPSLSEAQALVNAMATQVAQWQELQTQLQELHAKLEYARLMLKLHTRGAPGPGA